MNHIYKTVWNEQTGTYVAVAEIAKSQGKRSSSSKSSSVAPAVLKAVTSLAFVLGLSGVVTDAYANLNLGGANVGGSNNLGGSGCESNKASVYGNQNIGLGCGVQVDGEIMSSLAVVQELREGRIILSLAETLVLRDPKGWF